MLVRQFRLGIQRHIESGKIWNDGDEVDSNVLEIPKSPDPYEVVEIEEPRPGGMEVDEEESYNSESDGEDSEYGAFEY